MSENVPAIRPWPTQPGDVKSRASWIAFLAIGLSFPVTSLFEEANEVTVSLFVIPAILTLPILALLGFLEPRRSERGLLILSCVIALAVNVGAGLLMFDESDPDKLYRFWGTLVMFGVLNAWVFYSARALKFFDSVFIVLGLVALLALVARPGQFDAGRFSYGDSNPIWMARAIGLLAIGSFSYALKNPRHRILAAVGVLAAVGGIVLTGSRGPLLALLIAFAMGAMFFRYKDKILLIGAGLILSLLLGTVVLGWDLLGTSRLLDFTGDYDASANLRAMLYDYSVYMIGVTPSGIGVGNFHFLFFPYPHNIYLEVLLEWGWLWGGVFIAMIAAGSIGVLQLPKEYNTLKMLLVFELINAGLSGDITSPRFLYGLVILGNAALFWRLRLTKQTESRHRPAARLPVAHP